MEDPRLSHMLRTFTTPISFESKDFDSFLSLFKTRKQEEKKEDVHDGKPIIKFPEVIHPPRVSASTQEFIKTQLLIEDEEEERQPEPKQNIDYEWLKKMCERELGVEDFANSIVDILQTAPNDSSLQDQLFNMLGIERIELIATIIENKPQILKAAYKSQLKEITEKTGQKKQTVSFGPTFQVKTSTQIELEKKIKKEARKTKKKKVEPESPPEHGIEAWLSKKDKPEVSSDKKSIILELFGEEMVHRDIPDDAKRFSFPKYEEYHIPPKPQVKDDFPLVPISIFENWAQLAFKGIKTLNRVQSRVYHAAYKTNENLLVCAPTGCGKTNIAMLAILREIGLHFREGVLRKEEFKIIYVAPMKALAGEMVSNFQKRLQPLGIKVREMTGDIQLSKKEIQTTQMIITTPEKWDVVTRKSTDNSLLQLVKLLIIDEVHLLNEDRGPVIESLVARTLRYVESSQSMIRIVGLSATLPNYEDVATFLRVNPEVGLFHFDNSYRPVPLYQQFIGVTEINTQKRNELYNEICFKKVLESVKQGHQVMVFVHSRKETYNTATALIELARNEQCLHEFEQGEVPAKVQQQINKSKNNQIKSLFPYSFSCHHAGMLRQDRNLVEQLFTQGHIKVLCCTATLAWGVNLPAHTVIIKGTTVYNAEKGSFNELGMLDVMQIFGRAGRPQFDTSGEGIIITSYKELPRYLRLLNHALPIESQMKAQLANALNAEIVLGTVTNLREAMQWLSYTYLYLRMLKNPMVYGIDYADMESDPMLGGKRRELVETTARLLDKYRMIRYEEESQIMTPTDLGRVASHYYIDTETIQLFNEKLHKDCDEIAILNILSECKEFSNIKVRDEEMDELEMLQRECPVHVKHNVAETSGKTNVLIQAYISSLRIKSFSLVSDTYYVAQSVGRIARALFEIVLRRGWMSMSDKLLTLTKCIDRRMWAFQHPLRQFYPVLNYTVIERLEDRKADLDRLANMEPGEIGQLAGSKAYGDIILKCVNEFPSLELDATVQPLTRNVLRVRLRIIPTFYWNKRFHGDAEPWWIWVDDPNKEYTLHSEYFLLKEEHLEEEEQILEFTIPVYDPKPPQYTIRAVSDRWIGAETLIYINLKDIILPESFPPHTDLLPLTPLPVKALNNPYFEKLYNFTHFNPIQTQVFHTVYHTDHSILLGSPTGSGKTIVAELAMLRLFNTNPEAKVVYIAPMKALVRERIEDWSKSFGKLLGKNIVELTGDFTPDVKLLKEADIVVSTPEKWDGISRNWQRRGYVRQVGLMIMDEIHLLGQERGPVLEVIVSRMRYIAWNTGQKIRFVGLSATLSNAKDVADWLGIDKGLYNFRQSVRPVPLTVHIAGFPGQHYCPRMARMNKPTYAAILQHSKNKPVLVFVSSRRQTRLTALDLINFCASDENPHKFCRMTESELYQVLARVKDTNLKHTLVFGIGMHHAGLAPTDKQLIEELFVNEKIQVLVCTATLAWGVNFPAHLVVIKGTEYFDPKTKKYVDYPITDVLQMMGRAGRPQYDNEGKCCVFVHESKKAFYKKFLYEPFPVESSLQQFLHDHFNAEIGSGTIVTKQDAVDYLTWTFMFRRLLQNPSYYSVPDGTHESLNKWLSEKVNTIIDDLEMAGLVHQVVEDGEYKLKTTTLGNIASFYYLMYKTVSNFDKFVTKDADLKYLLQLVSEAMEYAELPVRHNEDKLNEELSAHVLYPVENYDYESPHTKTYLLLQAHFSRLALPITDYITDTKTVLDNTIRILQGFIDIAAFKGYLNVVLQLINILQMSMQGRWIMDNSLLTLPHITHDDVNILHQHQITCLPEFLELSNDQIQRILSKNLTRTKLEEVLKVKEILPKIDVEISIQSNEEKGRNVNVHLTRVSKLTQYAYTPKYSKPIHEGFYLIIGDESGELIAMKRIQLREKMTTTLKIPEKVKAEKLDLYLMTDSYIGLDQQYSFLLKK